MSQHPSNLRQTARSKASAGRFGAALIVGLALSLAACTSTEQDAVASSSTTQVMFEDDPITAPESESPVEPSGEFEVVLTEAEGISEEPAEEPVVDESEPVEIEFEESAEAAQAGVGVSESALCATLQIGRDAVVDGDGDLADDQRDLIIERADRLEDDRLATILAALDADRPLDISIAEDGLERCQTLGFEI